MQDIYDERGYDSSLPNSMTEEFFACAHILYKIAVDKGLSDLYTFVDKWFLSECDELEGVVPMEVLADGQGLILVEYLRDVELQTKKGSS